MLVVMMEINVLDKPLVHIHYLENVWIYFL